MRQDDLKAIVRETLLAAIPPGCPPSFQSIDGVKAEGTGRKLKITAQLTMFDGAPSTVLLEQWAYGWSTQWIDPNAVPCMLVGNEWMRDPDFTLEARA